MKRFALLAVLLLVAGCGSLVGPKAHTLSLTYKAGDTYKYKLHTTSKQTVTTGGMSLPVEFEISARESIKVRSVDKSGTADLELTLTDVTYKSSLGGTTNTTTTQPFTIDMQVASDGRLVSVEGNLLPTGTPIEAFSGLGGGFFVSAVLPNHPVKPGDSWTKDYDQANTMGSGGLHITSTSTYLRNESLSGVNAAVVETKSTITIDMTYTEPAASPANQVSSLSIKGTVTTDVTTWIDPDGHRVLKTHSTAADDATMEATAPPTGQVDSTGPFTAKGSATTDLAPA